MVAGHVAPWGTLGMEIARADTRMHVDTGRRGQSFGFIIGTLGMDHAHVCHCFVTRVLFGKQGHVHPAVLSHQCRRLQFDFLTKPGVPTGIDDKRCATKTDGCGSRDRRACCLETTKGKAEAADLLRACARASAHQFADESSHVATFSRRA